MRMDSIMLVVALRELPEAVSGERTVLGCWGVGIRAVTL